MLWDTARDSQSTAFTDIIVTRAVSATAELLVNKWMDG